MTRLEAILILIHEAKVQAASRSRYRKVIEACCRLHLNWNDEVEVEQALGFRDENGLLCGWVTGTDKETA